MNRLRTLRRATRAKIEHLSRRDVLVMGASAVAMKAVDIALDKLVVDPLLERKIETYRARVLNIDRMETHGSDQQRAALDAWRLATDLPEFAVDRSTMTYPGPDGSQWVDWQGGIVSRLLGWEAHQRHIPMREQPDRAFGAWSERRLAAIRSAAEPIFWRIKGCVEGIDGETEQDYSILALPLSDGRVLTTSASWPKTPSSNPERVPMTRNQVSEDQGHGRFAST